MNAGHPDFFDLIYRENYSRIFRYSFRLVGNSEDAEQLTQESFKSLYALCMNGTRIVDGKALAYRIAHNVCLNFLKRDEKLKNIMKQEAFSPRPSAPSAEDVLIANRGVEFLRRAILSLPKRDRECLLLYLEGLTYNEIAEISHIRRTSIGKVLARAINNLSGLYLRRELR